MQEKKSDRLTAQFISTVFQNVPVLTSENMMYWMKHPKQLRSFLSELSKQPKSETAKKMFSLTFGMGEKNGKKLIEEMEREGYYVSNCAKEILQNIFPQNKCIAEVFKRVWLVFITPRELGFTEPVSKSKICKKAVNEGFFLCWAEIGPQLRLQYPNQEVGEELLVGMYCCLTESGSKIFTIRNSSYGQELDCSSGEILYDPESIWVFIHPKNV